MHKSGIFIFKICIIVVSYIDKIYSYIDIDIIDQVLNVNNDILTTFYKLHKLLLDGTDSSFLPNGS